MTEEFRRPTMEVVDEVHHHPFRMPTCPTCGLAWRSGTSYDAGRVWVVECKNGHTKMENGLAIVKLGKP